jgi:hypothetical protein
MTKYLIETLTKHATNVTYATSSNSIYFTIDGIKVRVSDHHTTSTKYDLAVYSVNNSYVCIPNNCPFKELIPCTKVTQVLKTIEQFAFAKRLYAPSASLIETDLDNIKRIRRAGLSFKDKSKIAIKLSSMPSEWVDVIEEYCKTSSEAHHIKLSRIGTFSAVSKNATDFKQHLFKTVKK